MIIGDGETRDQGLTRNEGLSHAPIPLNYVIFSSDSVSYLRWRTIFLFVFVVSTMQ